MLSYDCWKFQCFVLIILILMFSYKTLSMSLFLNTFKKFKRINKLFFLLFLSMRKNKMLTCWFLKVVTEFFEKLLQTLLLKSSLSYITAITTRKIKLKCIWNSIMSRRYLFTQNNFNPKMVCVLKKILSIEGKA